jgi:GNAT superfamily N-acetyltransferase
MNNQNPNRDNLFIVEVDYTNEQHLDHLAELLNAYSMDKMGNGTALDESVLKRLKGDLKNVPGAYSFIAYLTAHQEAIPIGLINCFMGYSTFVAKPLLNIHDIVVLDNARGKGVGALLIEAAEKKALELGCCKLTLEVRTDNPAERLYRRLGFTDGDNPMIFLTKKL